VVKGAVLALALAAGCSSSSSSSGGGDGGAADVSVDHATEAGDAGDARVGHELGRMSLLQLGGLIAAADGGSTPAILLVASASFQPVTVVHDFDDRVGELGCFADHYDTTTRPAPADGAAGSLRMTGYTGGQPLTGTSVGQPIVCVQDAAGYYGCIFPSGAATSTVPFPAGSNPLGAGPITFGSNAGADFGAAQVSDQPDGTLTVTDALGSIHYTAAQDTTLHLGCTGCASSRVAVRLEAFPSADASAGWPYTSVGIVDCVLAGGTTVVVPSGAIAAMFSSDTALDTVRTQVVRLPAQPASTSDPAGDTLRVEVGSGVFGVAPR
jgi:hypothetical protein